jgi:ABC-2 type transport system ATP-binding protein
VTAVRNISFQIGRGEAVAFLGPNGAGKTTTIKMLTGLIFPSAGTIDVLGFQPFERKQEFLQQIGLVMGNKTGLNWDLTAQQSFELLRKIYRIGEQDYRSRLAELSQLLSVDKFLDTQIRRLSLGERMKLELIGSLLHRPKLLLLDEPTIGLDIHAKQKIRQFLRQIQSEYDVTMMLTSHDMDDVENVCDRVIVINNGSIATDSKLTSLIAEYNHFKYVKIYVALDAQLDTKMLLTKAELVESREGMWTLKVERENLPQLIAEVASKYKIEDIDIESTPLETIIGSIFTQTK